jgi:hypothetical protein
VDVPDRVPDDVRSAVIEMTLSRTVPKEDRSGEPRVSEGVGDEVLEALYGIPVGQMKNIGGVYVGRAREDRWVIKGEEMGLDEALEMLLKMQEKTSVKTPCVSEKTEGQSNSLMGLLEKSLENRKVEEEKVETATQEVRESAIKESRVDMIGGLMKGLMK